jgi:thiol-disulfide isomerase/thioredoxin
MSESTKPDRRKIAMITLFAGGIFLLGAGLIPLVAAAQQRALIDAANVYPPVTLDSATPQLAFTDLAGRAVSFEDLRGRMVLVNNWATWCPPCKDEIPELEAYQAAHQAEGFLVVAIESGETADQVTAFVRENGVTLTIWLDPTGSALDAFQNWDLPSSYVIDRDGRLRMAWTGAINQATLEKFVTPLLEENK